MIHGMYEVDEAAALVGLAPRTLRLYTSGRATSLVRGRDFTVLRRRHFGRVRARLLITRRGLERILARDYVRIHPADRRVSPSILDRMHDDIAKVWPTKNLNGRIRQREARFIALARALRDYPCQSETCKCRCHSLAYGVYSASFPPNRGPGEDEQKAKTS